MPFAIAIDGPVGAGKSTISDQVAERLHILHMDTGAMYRAVGLSCLRAGVDINDEAAVTKHLQDGKAEVCVRYADSLQHTLLNGEDVSTAIRTQEAGTAASAVSRYQAVRHAMVALQRDIAKGQSVLLDGRDIGTVVLPHADVKIFLTSSDAIRAERRQKQLAEKGEFRPFEEILAEVRARDLQDETRAIDPLRKADDAVIVDSTELTIEETVDAILSIVHQRTAGKA